MNKKLTVFLIFSAIFYFSAVKAESFQFNKDLYFGMNSDQGVTNLQQFLTDSGFYSGPITGNFFSLTREAVRKYQSANSITPVSGYFGPITRALANKVVTITEIDSRSALEKQIAAMEKQLSDLQSLLTAVQSSEQVSVTPPVATSTPETITTPTPEVSLPNPFDSTLKIESIYPSFTLGRYKDIILNAITLTAQEKIAITKIRFTNTGTLGDYYFTDLRLIERNTNTVIANASGVSYGILEFIMTADDSKADKGLMVSGKAYDIIATLLTPNYSGVKPYVILEINSSDDVSAFDYNDLTRVAKITSQNIFPIPGPRISTF